MKLQSRWFKLVKTSPSGKTLFVCLICGRESIAPDKRCPETAVTCGPYRRVIDCEMEERLSLPYWDSNHVVPPALHDDREHILLGWEDGISSKEPSEELRHDPRYQKGYKDGVKYAKEYRENLLVSPSSVEARTEGRYDK